MIGIVRATGGRLGAVISCVTQGILLIDAIVSGRGGGAGGEVAALALPTKVAEIALRARVDKDDWHESYLQQLKALQAAKSLDSTYTLQQVSNKQSFTQEMIELEIELENQRRIALIMMLA